MLHFSFGGSAAQSAIGFLLEPFGVETGSVKSQDTCHTAPLVDYKLGSNIVTSLNKGFVDRGCCAMTPSFAIHVVTAQVVNEKTKPLRANLGKWSAIAEIEHRVMFASFNLNETTPA